MTARPINAMSAVCSMICSKPDPARRKTPHYDLVGETLGEFRRAGEILREKLSYSRCQSPL